MLQEADCSDDLALLNDADLAAFLSGAEVTWVTDDLLGLDGLAATCHSSKLAVRVSDNGIDLLVEHVSTTIDGTQASERLGKFAETVQGVDVRRLSVASHRGSVEDNAVVGGAGRFGDVTNLERD